VCKHRKVSVARAHLATSWKLVSFETSKVLYEPFKASCKAKQTMFKSNTVSTETNIASHQCINVAREAKVPCEPKITSTKAMWIAKSVISCEARDRSLDSASCEAKIVSDCKTIPALHRAKPRLSREAKTKTLYANSEATAAPLTSSALLSSAKITLSREAKTKATLGAESEAIITSLKSRALLGSARLATSGRTKALSTQMASPCEANSTLL